MELIFNSAFGLTGSESQKKHPQIIWKQKNTYICVCVYLCTHIYMRFWYMTTEEIQFRSFAPKVTLRHKAHKVLGSRDGFSERWWVVRIHAHPALGAPVYLDWRDRAVHAVRSWCDLWRQTVSKCKHKQSWRTHRPEACWGMYWGTVRDKFFLVIRFHCKGYILLPSSRKGSWVRFWSSYYSLELTLKWK